MLRSLSARLLVAFAFVIVLSLALSGVGTLFLLREREQEDAEERVGRLAEPLTMAAALLEQAGLDEAQIEDVLRDYAESFGVRLLLVDGSGRVVADTESSLTGHTVDAFRGPGLPVVRRGGVEFHEATYSAGGEELRLFASAHESLQLSANRLLALQTFIFTADASSLPLDALDAQLADLIAAPELKRTLRGPSLKPVVAVPEGQITSAWRDIIPQLAIAGGIALLASVAAAVLISRSISRPLARVTKAAQEMARGNYDQELDLRGEDEVGRLGQAFDAMARQVNRSHQMMRDLLANVSHELKTPLTSIQGFSQALEEGAISSPEEYREAGRIINEETQRMRSLVDDLIELSQLESGQAVLQREPIDLDDLLRVCARRFEFRLRDSGATMRLDLQSPQVEGDERRLEQAFTNLIDNAVRHTPRDHAITVGARAENGLVRVSVHNTGSYIAPDDLPRLFERFYQLDRNRARQSGGAGLGLAIASEVIQAHGGEIHAVSDEEKGTEFTVTLPVETPPSNADRRPAKEDP